MDDLRRPDVDMLEEPCIECGGPIEVKAANTVYCLQCLSACRSEILCSECGDRLLQAADLEAGRHFFCEPQYNQPSEEEHDGG